MIINIFINSQNTNCFIEILLLFILKKSHSEKYIKSENAINRSPVTVNPNIHQGSNLL